MDIVSQDMANQEQLAGKQADSHDLPPAAEISPELIDYESQRQPLWDIHQFVERVLATEQPGFLITFDRQDRRIIKALPLAWYYRRIGSYSSRIPDTGAIGRYIGLFHECCIEMELAYNGFSNPGNKHRPGMTGAELYNAFLDLIRKKASEIKKYIDAKAYVSNYDRRMFERLKSYIDGLFLIYSKLLVVRLDLEYREEFADYVTLAQAKEHIGRFISHRRWSKLFEHCVGFVIARERGENGTGFHFHCILFFDGQKQSRDLYLASAIGQKYWEGYITRISGEGESLITQGRYFSCNGKKGEYRYEGIGMITHSDEVKRANLLYNLLYLTKNDQGLGSDAPSKTRTLTRSLLPRVKENRTGPPRKILLRGKRVTQPKQITSSDTRSIKIS